MKLPFQNAGDRCIKSRHAVAFTLLEVMVAAGIFFMAIFSILELVSSNIRNARRLQEPQVDPALLLADLSQTNVLTEGSLSGDFGELYPGYQWASETQQMESNGWFKVVYVVTKPGGDANSETSMGAYFYRTDSPAGAGFKP